MAMPKSSLAMPRIDKFPDDRGYQDTGCDLFSRCLECPLPKCRYDEESPRSPAKQIYRRNEEIRMLRRQGASTEQLLSQFGISRRQFVRIMAEGRNGGEGGVVLQ